MGYVPPMTIFQNGKPQKITLPLFLTRNEHVKFQTYKSTPKIADELLCGPRTIDLVRCDGSPNDLFKEIADGGKKYGMTKRMFELNATTKHKAGIYEFCVDVKIDSIPGFEIKAGKDKRMRIKVEVKSIAKYVMAPSANRPPYFKDDAFSKLDKVQYFEGDEISLSWAGADADDDD